MNQHSIGNFGIYIQPILEAQLSYINLLNSNMQKYKISAFQVNYNHYTCTMASDVNEYMTQFLIAQQDSEMIYTVVCVFGVVLLSPYFVLHIVSSKAAIISL